MKWLARAHVIMFSLAACAAPNEPIVDTIDEIGPGDPSLTFNPATDNSPYSSELAFITDLGLMDGTNCDRWPKDYRIDQTYPPNATAAQVAAGEATPALNLQPMLPTGSEAEAVTARILRRMAEASISKATVFGSKYQLDVREIDDPTLGTMTVALDPQTLTGFAISRMRMCTQYLAERTQCTIHRIDVATLKTSANREVRPSDLVPTTYAILIRNSTGDLTNELLTDRTLAVVTAPKITFWGGVFDGDTMFIGDAVHSRGTFKVEPRVAHTNQTWQQALAFVTRPPFFGVIAGELTGLSGDLYNGGGTDIIEVSDDPAFTTDLAPGFRRSATAGIKVKMHPGPSVVAGTPQSRAGLFTARYDAPAHVAEIPAEITSVTRESSAGCEDECSSTIYHAVATQQWESKITISTTHATKREANNPEPMVFVACKTGAACTQAAIDTSLRINRTRRVRMELLDINRFTDAILRDSIDKNYLAPRGMCTGRQANPAGVYCFHDSNNRSCPHQVRDRNNGVTCVDNATCLAQAQANPWELNTCRRIDMVRVCLETPSGSPACATHTQYSLASNTRNTVKDAIRTQMRARYFFEERPPRTDQSLVPTFNRRIGDHWLPAAELLTRGLHFELLEERLENESRRTGVMDKAWTDLYASLDLFPRYSPSTPNDYTDFSKMSESFALRKNILEKLFANSVSVEMNNRSAVRVNAIGQPFGPVAGAWAQPASATGQPTFFLGAMQDRWDTTADEIERLNNYIRFGNLQGTLRQHAEAGYQMAKGVHTFATERKQQLEEQRASAARTAQRAAELGAQILQFRQDYLDGMMAIWGCDALKDPSTPGSCEDVLSRQLGVVYAQCVANSNMVHPIYDAFLSVVGSLGPYGKAVEAANRAIINIDLALQRAEYEDIYEHSRQTGLGVLDELQTPFADLEDAYVPTKAMGEFLGALVNASQYGCASNDPVVLNLLGHAQDMFDMSVTLDSMALDLAELTALLRRFQDDVAFYQASAATYSNLESTMQPIVDFYDTQRRSSPEFSRAFVINACPLAKAAVDASMIDIYRATQSLAATTGSAWSAPYLRIPASPDYPAGITPGIRAAALEHGFLFSIWDAARFRSRIFDPAGRTGPGQDVVREMIARFDEYKLREVCRTGAQALPNGLYLIVKSISGAELDAFFGRNGSSPRLRFEVTVQDLAWSQSKLTPAELNPAKMYDRATSTKWLDLAPPVVLGMAYRAYRRTSIGPLSGTNSSWAGPGIVAPKTPLIPSMYCSADPVRSNSTFTYDAREVHLETCPTKVHLPLPGAETLAAAPADPSTMLDNYRSSSNTSAAFCQVSLGTLVPNSLMGRPVLGTWTITADRIGAAQIANELSDAVLPITADTAFQNANSDVHTLEVFIVAGTEILSKGENARFALTP